MFGTIPPYFWGIVPIEKGQTFLPVPRVQHLIKRCNYEFLPHATSGIEKFLLDPIAVSWCADGIWKSFSLPTAPQSLRCEMSWLPGGLCYTKGRKSILRSHLQASRYGRNLCGFRCWPHLWPLTASDYPDSVPWRAHDSSQSGRKSSEKPAKSRKKSGF